LPCGIQQGANAATEFAKTNPAKANYCFGCLAREVDIDMAWHFIVSSWWLWYLVWFFAVIAFFTSHKITGGIVETVKNLEKVSARLRKRRTRIGYLLSASIWMLLYLGVCLILLFSTPVMVWVYVMSLIIKR
jgi:hypothetical protein